jgi:AmiR/NasT family two-component response regulator
MKSMLRGALLAARKPEACSVGTGGIAAPQRRAIIGAQDTRLRRELREGLAALGFITWGEVSDGLAAFTQIRRAHPHLVVLALPLASMDGEQIAEMLIRGAVAPVVLVGQGSDGAAETAVRELCFCAWLTRPFTQPSLAESVSLARWRFDRLAEIRAELRRLQRERSGRMLMERAKSLLMRRLQIGEPEAFWQIQQYCLESNESARSAVEAFIEANRLVLER